jgi:hypothetical protein
MAWSLFQWGSRGLYWKTDVEGIYVAHIPIPGGIRTVLQAENNITGQEYLNVLNFKAPGASVSAADCAAVNTLVVTWWNNNYRHMCAILVVGRQVVSTGMDVFPAAQASQALAFPGDRAGVINTSATTLAVKFATGVASRRHRGRHYAFPAVENDVAGDQFTSAYVTALVGVWDNLIAAAQTAGYPLVIASLADAALYLVSTAIAVDATVDSQRRRLPGRGR